MDAEGVKLREGEKKTEHFAIWCTNNILAHIRAGRRRIKCGSLMTLLYNIYDTICVGSFIFIQYYIRYIQCLCCGYVCVYNNIYKRMLHNSDICIVYLSYIYVVS